MKKVCFFAILIIVAVSSLSFANSTPVVSNVTVAQRGDDSKLVDIHYNLIDGDGDACTVWVSVSNNGGLTWHIPFLSSSGDLGSNIAPGYSKHIVWDAGKDIPGTIATLKVRVFADDGNGSDSLIMIPADTYQMGDHYGVGGDDEVPVHTVQVNAFMMAKYETTNQQYCEFLNHMLSQNRIYVSDDVVYAIGDTSESYPYLTTLQGYVYSRISRITGTVFTIEPADKETHPVIMVSWYGAVAYCNWRSEQHGLTPSYNTSTWACNFNNEGFRLPTEAEWEWATRTASTTNYWKYHWGNTIAGYHANYNSSGDPFEGGEQPWTTPVGYYNGDQVPEGYDMITPNGLYDMAGNVFEWCNDRYASDYYSYSPTTNPTGPGSVTSRVTRGGAWHHSSIDLRSAERRGYIPSFRHYGYGFRVVLDFN